MSKIKYLLFLCAMIFMYSNAQAKVCFLPGGCVDSPKYDAYCPGCYTCEVPKINMSPCACSQNVPLYAPEDCCSDGQHTTCEEPKVCARNSICGSSVDENGKSITYCDGECVCPDDYKECSSPHEGVGASCTDSEGTKYKECKCPSEYELCNGNNQEPKDNEESCTDSEGTKYKQCQCNKDITWTYEKPKCCKKLETCILKGKTSYFCTPFAIQNCKCAEIRDSNECLIGCDDDKYTYKGPKDDNANYENPTTPKDDTICATGVCCKKGYWDKDEYCTSDYNAYCKKLGYTDTSCSGDAIACPCEPSMKKCIGGEPLCDTSVYNLWKCPENTICDECTDEDGTFFKFKSCASGYYDKCQTEDSCSAVVPNTNQAITLTEKCAKCNDGYTYFPTMTGYQCPIIDSTNNLLRPNPIYSYKPLCLLSTVNEVEVAGCKCTATRTCAEEYSYTSCPNLAQCDNCKENSCYSKSTFYKKTGCVNNAEDVDGTCKCKSGYVPDGNACVTCTSKYGSNAVYENGKCKCKSGYYLSDETCKSCQDAYNDIDAEFKKTLVVRIDYTGVYAGSVKDTFTTLYPVAIAPNCSSQSNTLDGAMTCSKFQVCTCQETCDEAKAKFKDFNEKCPDHTFNPNCRCDWYIPSTSENPSACRTTP